MKINLKKQHAPTDLLGRPVWIVYGDKCFPQIMCAKIHMSQGTGAPIIWGYSVWKKKPGFRTLGIDMRVFIERHNLCTLYDNQEQALKRLRKLTRPR